MMVSAGCCLSARELQNGSLIPQERLQFCDGHLTHLHLMFDREMSGATSGLSHRHPGGFKTDAREGHMGRTRGYGDKESIHFLRDHDAIRNLIRPGDLLQHAEVAFQHDRIAWLAFLSRETVDGKFSDRDGVWMETFGGQAGLLGDVAFTQGELAREPATFTHIELDAQRNTCGKESSTSAR